MNGEKGILFTQGNEACACVGHSMRAAFFAGYPITPSTEVAELLSEKLPHVGGRFIQMEDEISSLCAVCAASVAGDKASDRDQRPRFFAHAGGPGLRDHGGNPRVVTSVQRGGLSTACPRRWRRAT